MNKFYREKYKVLLLIKLQVYNIQKLKIYLYKYKVKMIDQKQNSTELICKKIQNYIFKFTDMLGKGNFSKVYKAHHEITKQLVAIKIIELNSLKSEKLEQLLFSEIDVLKKLNHINILRCYEVFTSNRNCYIITEICNGGDLETKLRRQHHFSEFAAQPIIKDIFNGLLYLAQKNVIHRDLKIANVFLHNGRAKIADFGFAKFTKQNFKDINIGSPIYMSPQGLIHNIYGPKTDIWAFGVLIYELLHGETPYAQCRTQAELKYHVGVPLNPKKIRQQLSPQIKQIILLCMQIDEHKRASAFDLQKMSYFQRMIEKSPLRRMDSPAIQKKYSTTSQKYVGVAGTLTSQNNQRHNFLMPKEQKNGYMISNPREILQKKSSSPISFPQQQRIGASTSKKIHQIGRQRNDSYDHRNQVNGIQSPLPKSIKNQNIINNLNMNSKIFSAPFAFKECVNILHYCRLIYKYIILLKETHRIQQNQIKILSGWVLYLIQEIKTKINKNAIIFDGQNGNLKEKKLREVANEYTKKYTQQLGEYSPAEMSINLFLTYAKNFYEKADSQITSGKDLSWLPLGHYIVMIVDCTNMLKKCYEQQSYKIFSTYKDLEQFLNRNKDTMDFHSYKLFRKKISFIKDRAN